MVGTPSASRSTATGATTPRRCTSPSSAGRDARNTRRTAVSGTRISTAHAAITTYLTLTAPSALESHLENQHGDGPPRHTRQLALGENHQVVLLDELQIQHPREQLAIQTFIRAGRSDIEYHGIDTAKHRDTTARRHEPRERIDRDVGTDT